MATYQLFAIMGHGPNDLKIPLVICFTRKEAQTIIDKLPKNSDESLAKHGWLSDEFSEGELRNAEGDNDDIYKVIFKDANYYSGCGSCYKVTIEEIVAGQPMVGWDLD